MPEQLRLLLALASSVVVLGARATTPDSCRQIGQSVAQGIQLAEPPRASVSELACGADLGIVGAALELGERYETGRGVTADQHRAAQLYKRAATGVAVYDQLYLPPARPGGRGMLMPFRNEAKSTRGDPDAEYRLALMRLEGRGIVRSPVRAQRLLRLAASKGHVEAARLLARLKPEAARAD